MAHPQSGNNKTDSGHRISLSPPGSGSEVSAPGVEVDPLAEYEKKEKCGIFGIAGPPDAVERCYYGLYALQHRGQESAGIAASDGQDISAHTGLGLVAEVFNKNVLRDMTGIAAIGHVRYSTSGSNRKCNAQPILEEYLDGQVAVAHNGNLINAARLRHEYQQYGHIFYSTSDTEIVIHMLAKPTHQEKPDPLAHVLRHLQGAFSMLFLFKDRLEACRDPWGFRPLVIGKTRDGFYCVASETCALASIQATFVREVEPGEIVTIDRGGTTLKSRFYTEDRHARAHCAFEHVYFASPSSTLFGDTVVMVRQKMGRRLAIESPVDADIVIPIPDSGRSAALGFSKQSGIPFEEGIVPNRYVGRSFLQPSQQMRDLAVQMKLIVIPDVVRDKRLVVVEDSIVRGTTTRGKILALRRAGAKEVHMRVSCPPIRHPCFFGIDFPTPGELIANGRTVAEIRDFIEVDSLAYLSLEGMLECLSHPPGHYCTACWSGAYPIPVDLTVSKFGLERHQLKMFE
ncbi:MAG: amidophosphoribosyltransferase [Phycisphaerae bacterium]|nr:amidophosphoribosyltransferase [Phycisphaerae bacterium]